MGAYPAAATPARGDNYPNTGGCRLAYLSRNMESFSVILKKIFRIMSHNIQMGRVREAQKYIAFFKMLPASDLPDDLGRELQQMINRDIELQ